MGELLAWAAVSVAALMGVTWVVSLIVKDASIVDLIWGFGFVLVAWVTYFIGPGTPRGLLLSGMVTVWGLRLSGYLVWRNVGKGEDYRYQAMRRKVGASFWIVSLLSVFGLQGVIMWIVAVPVVVTQTSEAGLGWLDFLGVALWLAGLAFESIGDLQLARFKRLPESKGKVMDRGLWRYTRHPNYFGDFCVWWGHYLVAAAGGAWWTVFSPALMSFMLLRVSGVAMLERTITSRRPGYEEYARRTNAFFPGPPRP